MKKINLFRDVMKLASGKENIHALAIDNEEIDFWDYLDLVLNFLSAVKAMKEGDWDTLLKEIQEIQELVGYLLAAKKEKAAAD